MTRYIAVLRGINVGGNRKILMKKLIFLLQNAGFNNVNSYIQSGNLIFDTDLKSCKVIAESIKEIIFKQYSFEVPVVVLTKESLENTVRSIPFLDETNVHVTFFNERPLEELVNQLDAENYLPDQFVVGDQLVYIKCGDKYHQTKLSNQFFEKKLKVTATTRNWKTVVKLVELVNA